MPYGGNIIADQPAPCPTPPSTAEGLLIRPMLARDASAVLTIYQAGLDTGQASFETVAPAWEAFDAARLPAHRHVAADAATGEILGWVAASAVSSRPVRQRVGRHHGSWRDTVLIERRSNVAGMD